MNDVFLIIAGTSKHEIQMGGAAFALSPVTIQEYVDFLSLPTAEGTGSAKEQAILHIQAGWLAGLFRRRVKNDTVDPIKVTPEWIEQHFPLCHLTNVRYILLNGKAEGEDEEKKAP